MSTAKRLTTVFNNSKEIKFDDNSKIIIMSDCHRGDGSWGDNFAKNKNIYMAALKYYYKNEYTYIEIGDGDELWENRSLQKIIKVNYDVFTLLKKFNNKKRLYFLYGNHDIVKRKKTIKKDLFTSYNKLKKEKEFLFTYVDIPEGLVLKHSITKKKIFLVHGHQGDFLNDRIWIVSRFLVRYIWRPLEKIGIRNPVSTATNNKKKRCVERKLIAWTKQNNTMLIAGHTHRMMFPKVGDHLYFNDGCSTNPRYITGIELDKGRISLVKWSVKIKPDYLLYVSKDIIAGPIEIENFFNNYKKE